MKLPLFIVTGTSGAGKTTIIPSLRKMLPDYIVFDGDSVIGKYEEIKCNWLSIANSIAQSGKRTIICSTIVPENLENCHFLDCFSNIYYINLSITDELVRERLNDRGWNEEMIKNYVDFSNWLRDNGETRFDPPLFSIESSTLSVEEVARKVSDYISSK